MKPAHKQEGSGCDVYGAQRLKLARCVTPLLHDRDWWIENGTLLGAVRHGTFIPHDDDLDLAVLVDARAEGVEAAMKQLEARLAAQLPAPYRVRAVRSYADKLEAYDPTAGKYALPPSLYGAADYHHVSTDIQMYTQDADGMVRACYRCGPHRVEIPRAVLLPLGSVVLEGVTFPCPRDVTAYLVACYGDIRETAVFDPATGLYHQPGALDAET